MPKDPGPSRSFGNFCRAARLVEVGSGEPMVANVLTNYGYHVTVIDPLDGLARGPDNFEAIRAQYPNVRIIRDLFTTRLARELNESFDAVFSISVLEHIPPEDLPDLFAATRMVLKSGGFSIHAVDHVLEGKAREFHEEQLLRVSEEQNVISQSGHSAGVLQKNLQQLLAGARQDLETYYLSAMGHNLWRGNLAYDEFPFRKCISVQFIARRP